MIRKITTAVMVVVVIAVGVCLYLATRQPQLISRLPPMTPSSVAAAEKRLAAEMSLPANPHQLLPHKGRSATARGNLSRLITINVSQDDVNIMLSGSKQVANDLANQGVSNAQVVFVSPDEVDATAVVLRDGGYHSITIDGSLFAPGNGNITFEPYRVRLGALPIPESSVDGLVRKESAKILASELPKLPIRVERVVIKDHRLLLYGQRKTH